MNMVAKTNSILGNQSGAALVIALIIMVVITLIALASSFTSIFEIKISGNKRAITDAFYATDGGINAITSSPTQSFNTNLYTDLVPNTSSTFNPFSISTVSNPTNIPSANAIVTHYKTQHGPPRGGGYSAVNVDYAYFQVQCTGNDSVGSGAKTTILEDVTKLAPVQ
jgi:Tfp pilus assembly protein PilX